MRRLHIQQLNDYERIQPQQLTRKTTNKWITNGDNNYYFNKMESLYISSITNSSIIDQYVSWVIGAGLKTNGQDITNIITDDDLELIVLDFKVQGNCAIQVVYDYNGEVVRLYHIPVRCLASNREKDLLEEPSGYWYSFDWNEKSTYVPEFIPAFGKSGETKTEEILYIKRNSVQPIYALPDWQSAVQYAELEMELSNFFIKRVKNNFSAGVVVNINQGGTYSDEEMDTEVHRVKTNLSGTNGDPMIISFNDNVENKTTVDTIAIPDAYAQFSFVSEEAESKIMSAHKINDPGLVGLPSPSGFSNDAQKMDMALDILMRNRIKPMRRTILIALESILKIDLEFEDFPKLSIAAVESGQTSKQELKKWRTDAVSSNVDKIMFNDETDEMIVKFNSKEIYTYYGVDFQEFLLVMEGAGICRTAGSNKWGSWYIGKTPSVGAALQQVLSGASYKKGGSLR